MNVLTQHPRLLPTVIMVIQAVAAVPYLMSGDYRRGVYWLSAAVLTATVTY